jgi:MFS family permease
MRLVKKEQLVSAIFVIVGIAMIGEGIIDVLFAPYFERILHGTPLVMGWLMSAQAIGGILGSFAVPRLSKIISPGRLMAACGLTFGSLIIVLATFPFLPVLLPVIAIAGAGAIGFFIPMMTMLQSNVANEYQGRIFGALSTIEAIAMLIGMGLASGLGDHIGIVPLLLIDAACNILAALLAFVLIRVSIQPQQPPTGTDAITVGLEAEEVTPL